VLRQAGILAERTQDVLLLRCYTLVTGIGNHHWSDEKLIPITPLYLCDALTSFLLAKTIKLWLKSMLVQGQAEMAADNKSLGRLS